MSYEGYQEFLCKNGHYYAHDAYEDTPEACPCCRAPWAYTHSVDQTNGMEEDCPWTMPGPTEEIGFDSAGRMCFKPLGEWRKV